MAEENNEDGIGVPLKSYRRSIDDTIVSLMVRAKWVNADTVEDIIEEQLKKCVHERLQISPDKHDLDMIES